MNNKYLAMSLIFFISGCGISTESNLLDKNIPQVSTDFSAEKEIATFAGGCFWCMEPSYQEHVGVIDAIVGYVGGSKETATYKAVASGETKHREAVQITYNPQLVSYGELLDIFWRQVDPRDKGGQFADRGHQYTTAIFYHNLQQKRLAQKSKTILEELEKFEKDVATKILPVGEFFVAEEYHQDFYRKSADYYKKYKKGSGRSDFIKDNWAKEAALLYSEEEEIKEPKDYNYTEDEIDKMRDNLDPLAYHVVVEGGTESPFENAYWDNKEEGIYVDKVTGEALFSSTHKYDSQTGWPSFYRTLKKEAVSFHEDDSLSITRTEIRSAKGDSHLGHVFPDGPKEEGGQRFCTNSASLKFVPRDEMEERNYGEYLNLFEEK